MDSLPFIDEHAVPFDAPASTVWASMLKTLSGMTGSAALARVLGCDPVKATPEFAGRPGDAVPGFRVVEAEPGRRLELRGRHRFSNYALTFVLDGNEIRAISHGAFPGLLGRLYRA
ncbi:MAG: hypothetical protein HOV81_38505, partial [Kofleriaceae bacterium]|nr:hypothetical protein [Kofleriaceae bacterium]